MAQSRESKFFLSGTVSPASVFRLNLQPKMCIPRILPEGKEEHRNVMTKSTKKHTNKQTKIKSIQNFADTKISLKENN